MHPTHPNASTSQHLLAALEDMDCQSERSPAYYSARRHILAALKLAQQQTRIERRKAA